ncbi:conserved hypothetical protein [Neospora caninum Liverpool]|uniref:G patch domain-containing protein n=1 Tax=Neospora caninum (strain Liverpool) TaxID=572307 RepID=F0VPK1_NEOCL|nr:conserved hypothetical protein [Neospora caninum Liverpool]CBZ55647.1 conserved hypothetical protein [Neospora caninum Liverpool]CEL70389.1 TPA: hypothetical protein BN1204_060720 [Neospora caninum Liverpool]|eukprot:XP_003885675.1 conserved hypothetical protein [Neospora caninum Liverpool]
MRTDSAFPAASAFLGTPFCPSSLDELYETIRAEKGLGKHEQPSLPALLSAAAKASRREASRLAASALRAKRAVSRDTQQLAEESRKARRRRIEKNARECAGDEQPAAASALGGEGAAEEEERGELANEEIQRQRRRRVLQESAHHAERLASEALVAAQGADANAEIGTEERRTAFAVDASKFRGAAKGDPSRGAHAVESEAAAWTPQSFYSSRQDRRMEREEQILQRPEDFMDEEDLQDAARRRFLPSSCPSLPPPQPMLRASSSRHIQEREEEGEEEWEDEERAGGRRAAKREVRLDRSCGDAFRGKGLEVLDVFCKPAGWLKRRFDSQLKCLRGALERERRELAKESGSRQQDGGGDREEGERGDSESDEDRGARHGEEKREETKKTVDVKRDVRPQLPPHLEQLRRLQKNLESMRERRGGAEHGSEGEDKQQKKGERGGSGEAPEGREEQEKQGVKRHNAREERESTGELVEEEKGEKERSGEEVTERHTDAAQQRGDRNTRGRSLLKDQTRERDKLEELLRSLLTEEEQENKRIAELHREAQEVLATAAEGTDATEGWLSLPRASQERTHGKATSESIRVLSSRSPEVGRSVQVFGGSALRKAGKDIFVVFDSDDEDRLIFEPSSYHPNKHFASVSGGGLDGNGEREAEAGRHETADNALDLHINQLFCFGKKEQTEASAWFPPPAPPPWFDGMYRPPLDSALSSVSHAGVARLLPRLRGGLLGTGDGQGDRETRASERDRAVPWKTSRTGVRSERSWGILAEEYSAERGDRDDALVGPSNHCVFSQKRGNRHVDDQPEDRTPSPQMPIRPSAPSCLPSLPSTGRGLPLWQGVSEEDKARILSRLFGDGEEKGREGRGEDRRKTFFSWSREKRRLPQWTREGELFPQAAPLERHQKQQLQRRKQEELEQKWRAVQGQIRGVRKEIEEAIKARPDKRMRWELFVGESEKEAEANMKQVGTACSTSGPLRSLPASSATCSASSASSFSSGPSSASSASSPALVVPASALSTAGCAAEDPRELDEFCSWHRRLSLLRAQLTATRREVAACAAESWRDGTFEVWLSEHPSHSFPAFRVCAESEPLWMDREVGQGDERVSEIRQETADECRNVGGRRAESAQGEGGEVEIKRPAEAAAARRKGEEEAETHEQTLTLETMLPLLSCRRTVANWAPNPTLCHRLGIPNPWARMPFFDDRKPEGRSSVHGNLVFSESGEDTESRFALSSAEAIGDHERKERHIAHESLYPAQPVSVSVDSELTTVETAVIPGCSQTNLFRAVFNEDPSDSSEGDAGE